MMVALPLAVLACASSGVKTSHVPDYDFSALTTYAIDAGQFTTDNASLMGQGVMAKLTQAVRRDLTVYKGLEEVAADSADVIVQVNARTQRQRDADPAMETGSSTRTTGRGRYYDAGTLTLDVLDRRADRVIWQGSTEKVVTGESSQDAIDHLVSELLVDFPPRAK